MNLYSKKVPELFRLAIGFKNQVCCNMCIFTDGYKDDLRVSNTTELYRAALELFSNYNPAATRKHYPECCLLIPR